MSRTSAIQRSLRERSLPLAVAISAILGAAYLLWQPPTTDLAAQTYRAELWEREGWVLWSPEWYGGFLVPGYSLLYPPLGALVGPAWVGALAAVAAAALFGSIALRAFGESAWLGVLWFGAGSTAAIWSGRITFALGLAVGLAALWCLQRRWAFPAGVMGLASAAASPVAGLFTALAAAAVVLASRFGAIDGSPAAKEGLPVPAAWATLIGAGAGVVALAVAFPTEGHHPFLFSAWWPIPLVAGAIALASRGRRPVLFWGSLLYLALALGAIVVETPLGGNTARLGATFAGPLAALLLIPRRMLLLGLAALPLLWWQWTAAVHDVAGAEGDPSTEGAYYEPLLDRLKREPGPWKRVHVLPTQRRWEGVHLPPEVDLAGGWLRQLEADDFDFLEQDELELAEYRSWLASRGVAYVAVSDAEPDRLAVAERRLLDSGRAGEPVWAEGPWRLYRIGDPRFPQIEGRGKLLDVSPAGFSIRMGPGPVTVSMRFTPYLEVTEGWACLERVEREVGWDATRIVPIGDLRPRRQNVRIAPRFSPAAALGREETCP